MTKTALIADDDSSIRGMLGRLLRPLGWTTVEVSDGCSALDRLAAQHIDLVILDQRMPQLTGIEVLSVIRGSATHSDIPVMVVTGVADAETSKAMLALGVSDYLVKPLRPEFVRDRLKRMDKIVRATSPKWRGRGQERPKDGSVLVVVDSDAEHRSFVNAVLMHRYQVLEVPSAVAALRACIVARPEIFILGADVGLMTPAFLARKLRERRELTDARIILVSPLDAVTSPAAFDGVIPKTSEPSEFAEQFDRLFVDSFEDEAQEVPRESEPAESVESSG